MRFRAYLITIITAAASIASAQVASHAPAIQPAAAGPSSVQVSAMAMKPVVRVNGAVLTQIDLTREMYMMFPYAEQHGGMPKSMEADIRKGALDMIVFEELLYQEAKRRNVQVPA